MSTCVLFGLFAARAGGWIAGWVGSGWPRYTPILLVFVAVLTGRVGMVSNSDIAVGIGGASREGLEREERGVARMARRNFAWIGFPRKEDLPSVDSGHLDSIGSF